MSSPSDRFECHWQASRYLLVAYLAAQGMALLAILLLEVAPAWAAAALISCVAHGAWVVPRQISLSSPRAFSGFRRSSGGWQAYSAASGWQPVTLLPDSIAQPFLVILRFRVQGAFFTSSVCLPRDTLAPELHRRLRLRLKFSRRRWAAAG